MVVNKNKHLTKKAANGAKKKVVDAFSKRDWYNVKAIAMFSIRNTGKLPATRTPRAQTVSDMLKG